MMKWTVAKEIKWEASHRLVKSYQGKCSHLHGHSWVAIVEVGLVKDGSLSGNELDRYDFIQDFAGFDTLRDWVQKTWDHATLVSSLDIELLNWLVDNKQRHFIFEKSNPTCEIIAKTLFEKAEQMVLQRSDLKVLAVRIKETCTSEACYSILNA